MSRDSQNNNKLDRGLYHDLWAEILAVTANSPTRQLPLQFHLPSADLPTKVQLHSGKLLADHISPSSTVQRVAKFLPDTLDCWSTTKTNILPISMKL